jgi:hypothetical protein
VSERNQALSELETVGIGDQRGLTLGARLQGRSIFLKEFSELVEKAPEDLEKFKLNL